MIKATMEQTLAIQPSEDPITIEEADMKEIQEKVVKAEQHPAQEEQKQTRLEVDSPSNAKSAD